MTQHVTTASRRTPQAVRQLSRRNQHLRVTGRSFIDVNLQYLFIVLAEQTLFALVWAPRPVLPNSS